nr:MAG: ORF1a protein [Jingmen bat astrovirus 12]
MASTGLQRPIDAALCLGSPTARVSALAADRGQKIPLHELTDETAVYQFFWYKTSGGTKVPACTSLLNGDVVTYALLDGWTLVDPIYHVPAITASSLNAERVSVKGQLIECQSQLASLRSEHMLLRHDYERIKSSQVIRKKRFDLWTVLLLSLLAGLLMGAATAEETNMTTPSQSAGKLNTNELEPWFDQVTKFIYTNLEKELPKMSTFGPIVKEIVAETTTWLIWLWGLWPLQCVLAVCYAFVSTTNPKWIIVALIVATVSGMRSAAMLAVNSMDGVATAVYGLSMFFYPFGPDVAVLVYVVAGLLALTMCMILPVDTTQFIHGWVVGLATIVVHTLMVAFSVPGVAFPVLLALWKIWRYIRHQPTQVCYKDAAGKIVDTQSVAPTQSWLSRMAQRLKKFTQRKPRTTQSTTFNFKLFNIFKVRNDEGEGTGFRVGNFIVTAKHVLAGRDLHEIIDDTGAIHPTKVKWLHPEKDIALLTLPPALQNAVPLKVSGPFTEGPVMIITETQPRLVATSAHGLNVSGTITYAVNTPNGASGAPVVDPTGKLVAIHVINTGFSAGGVSVCLEDVTPPPKIDEVAKLKKEIEELKAKKYNQANMGVDAIVELVREAVRVEMMILRKELAQDSDEEADSDSEFTLNQAKGKTKRGKTWKKNATKNRVHSNEGPSRKTGGKKKQAVWTEAEYKELLEKGYTVDQLKELADDIRERGQLVMAIEDDTEAGFPNWEELDDEYEEETNTIWFGQYKPFPEKYREEWEELGILPDFDEPMRYAKWALTPEELDCLRDDARRLALRFNELVNLIRVSNEWKPEWDKMALLSLANLLWKDINMACVDLGIPPFFLQRKPKNWKRGATRAPEKKEKEPVKKKEPAVVKDMVSPPGNNSSNRQ